MFKLFCKSQNYAWGKKGLDSLVGKIHAKNHPEDKEVDDKMFAEYWMGDHPNGPSMVHVGENFAKIDESFYNKFKDQTVSISVLFEHNPKLFLGEAYQDKFFPDH